MKAILLTFCTLTLFSLTTMAQFNLFVREKDPKTGKTILHGKVTFQDVQDESVNAWFYGGANAYEPREAAISVLRRVWGPYRFVVFMGTWCEDTQDLLPKFYKILNQAGIDLHAVEMYGVDRNKKSLHLEEVAYKITHVPTFIVLRQNREVGRITERPGASIEEDLAALMQKDFDELERQRAERFK
jgi:thiol-disulfide isomerase/thioredoxin